MSGPETSDLKDDGGQLAAEAKCRVGVGGWKKSGYGGKGESLALIAGAPKTGSGTIPPKETDTSEA